MLRQLLIISIIVTLGLAEGRNGFEYTGVMSVHQKKHLLVKREVPSPCSKRELLTNKMVWTGEYAHPDVPKVCKSTFVHTTGKLQPIKLYDDVETYGELETLAFIKEMQSDDRLMLVDSRKQQWYDYMTIPGAVNVPFHYFKYWEAHEFEFENALRQMGVRIIDDEHHYDFKNAKTLLLFCNGAWCSQSPSMIDALVEIGYPEEKIKWYRGGMQSWLGAGMTSTLKR